MNTLTRGINTEGSYTFISYDPKAPVSEAGRRTAKVMYKTNMKTGVKAGNNVCLLVEPLSRLEVLDNTEKLVPHIIAMLEAEQDRMIKDFHISDDSIVSPESISLEAIITSLESTATSSARINKEVLSNWFDNSLADTLTVLFADKLGISANPTTAEVQKVQNFMAVYKTKYSGLASNLVSYSVEEADKLLIAIDKVAELDTGFDRNELITAKVIDKLTKMKTPVNVAEYLDL